jgi:hypothetical protein
LYVPYLPPSTFFLVFILPPFPTGPILFPSLLSSIFDRPRARYRFADSIQKIPVPNPDFSGRKGTQPASYICTGIHMLKERWHQ